MAKLANLNSGNAPTTMAGRFGHSLLHVHCDENVPDECFPSQSHTAHGRNDSSKQHIEIANKYK